VHKRYRRTFIVSCGSCAIGIFTGVGCTTALINPQLGITTTGIEAATKPIDEIHHDVQTVQREPGAAAAHQCEIDARAAWWVENLLGIAQVYQFDLWLDQKARETHPELLRPEPAFMGDSCVRNPFFHPADPQQK
jgi:hypothetical protein